MRVATLHHPSPEPHVSVARFMCRVGSSDRSVVVRRRRSQPAVASARIPHRAASTATHGDRVGGVGGGGGGGEGGEGGGGGGRGGKGGVHTTNWKRRTIEW